MDYCEKCDKRMAPHASIACEKIYGDDHKFCGEHLREEMEEQKKCLRRMPSQNIGLYLLYFVLPQLLAWYFILSAIFCTGEFTYNGKEHFPFLMIVLSSTFEYGLIATVFCWIFDIGLLVGTVVWSFICACELDHGAFMQSETTYKGSHYEATYSGNSYTVKKVDDYEGNGAWFWNLCLILITMIGMYTIGFLLCIIFQTVDSVKRKKYESTFLEAKKFLDDLEAKCIIMFDCEFEWFDDRLKAYDEKCKRRYYEKEEIKDIQINLPNVLYKEQKNYLVAHRWTDDIAIFAYYNDNHEINYRVAYQVYHENCPDTKWNIVLAEDLTGEEEEFKKYIDKMSTLRTVLDRCYDIKAIMEMQN